MARLNAHIPPSGHTVLVVDDDQDLRQTLVNILKTHGHTVLTADSGPAALEVLQHHEVHVMLLDYFMPGMTGEEVVSAVRTFNTQVQIVLQTGYASERPAREMMRDLDIQGYHDKSEGPEKLLVWTDAALKSYRHASALHAAREGLTYILNAAPQLHRLQPLDELLRGILLQLQGLLGFRSAWLATLPDPSEHSALMATPDQQDFRIRVATGRFEHAHWRTLDHDERHAVLQTATSGQTTRTPYTALPLTAGERLVGVILLDRPLAPTHDLHLLEIFAAQAAIAIDNARLYELATVDDLTGLVNKRAWLGRLQDALTLAARYGHPTSVLMLDLDHFKQINDTHGHLAGDQLLAEVGRVIRRETRQSDLPGRYGGEELVLLLPHTAEDGAQVAAERFRQAIEQIRVTFHGAEIRATVSIGAATLPGGLPLDPDTAARLLDQADRGLYLAKRAGRNRLGTAS